MQSRLPMRAPNSYWRDVKKTVLAAVNDLCGEKEMASTPHQEKLRKALRALATDAVLTLAEDQITMMYAGAEQAGTMMETMHKLINSLATTIEAADDEKRLYLLKEFNALTSSWEKTLSTANKALRVPPPTQAILLKEHKEKESVLDYNIEPLSED